MYYRVAIQQGGDRLDSSSTWEWKSSPLASLNTLMHWLQVYRALPHERLRIFSSCSREELNEQLARENQGLESTSLTAAQFLQERRLALPSYERTPSTAVVAWLALPQTRRREKDLDGRSMNALERRRLELELGTGSDHDVPYSFCLPLSLPQVLAWIRLMSRVQHSELQP
jgi:hypothetical protein